MSITQQLQSKGNLLSPNVRVDDTNLIGYDGNPQNIDTDPSTNTVGERAILAAAVSTLYADSEGRYYVKTSNNPMTWQAFGSGSGGGGDSVTLETVDDDWRIINDHPYLKFQREEEDPNDSSKTIWKTHVSMGAGLSANGIVLTKPYNISYDLANTQDSENPPNKVEVVSVTGVDENLMVGNSHQQSIINTKRGTNVATAQTLSNEQEVENRALTDKEIVIDRRDTPDADSVTSLSWQSDINFSAGTIDWIRFNEILFDIVETSDDTNGIPVRIAVESLDGTLIQETISKADLEAGVNNPIVFKPGAATFYPISPAYEEKQSAVSIVRIDIPAGTFVKLKGGSYDYTTPDDPNTVLQQDVPYQKSKIEYFTLGDIMDTVSYRDLFISESAISFDLGKLGLKLREEANNVDIDVPMIGVSEHDNLGNVNVGNFNDRTYVNAGSGGIWSLVEDAGTDRVMWSTADLAAQDAGVAADQFLEVTEYTFELMDALTTALAALETWSTVNCLNLVLPIDFQFQEDPDNPQNVTKQRYRTIINAHGVSTVLQESVSDFEFQNGFERPNYTIPLNQTPGTPVATNILLPRETYTLNSSSPRTITVQFERPTRIYGWYDNPADPADPQPDEFVPSLRLNVRRVEEQKVLTGATLDERLDDLLGSEEYRTAQENEWNTLHIDPEGKQVLADKDGNWIYFWDTDGLFNVTDMHQYLYRDGRESIYQPTAALNFTTNGMTPNADNYLVADPLVVHLKQVSACRSFHVSLMIDDDLELAQRNNALGVQFTFFVNTYGNSNSHSITVSVPWDFSMRYSYTSDRSNNYTHRAQIFNNGLAATTPDTILDTDIPADPDAGA